MPLPLLKHYELLQLCSALVCSALIGSALVYGLALCEGCTDGGLATNCSGGTTAGPTKHWPGLVQGSVCLGEPDAHSAGRGCVCMLTWVGAALSRCAILQSLLPGGTYGIAAFSCVCMCACASLVCVSHAAARPVPHLLVCFTNQAYHCARLVSLPCCPALASCFCVLLLVGARDAPHWFQSPCTFDGQYVTECHMACMLRCGILGVQCSK
jgi:hypothetical protein